MSERDHIKVSDRSCDPQSGRCNFGSLSLRLSGALSHTRHPRPGCPAGGDELKQQLTQLKVFEMPSLQPLC